MSILNSVRIVDCVLIRAEESARVHSAKFIPASNTIVQKAEALFAGTSMPKSDTTWTG